MLIYVAGPYLERKKIERVLAIKFLSHRVPDRALAFLNAPLVS